MLKKGYIIDTISSELLVSGVHLHKVLDYAIKAFPAISSEIHVLKN